MSSEGLDISRKRSAWGRQTVHREWPTGLHTELVGSLEGRRSPEGRQKVLKGFTKGLRVVSGGSPDST